MKRICLLFVCLVVPLVHGQGTSILSYRLGTASGLSGGVSISEATLRLPVYRTPLGDKAALATAVGYHHADFGSDMRFWGTVPMDSWMAEGSVTVSPNASYSLIFGSSWRISRISRDATAGPVAFTRTGVVYQRNRLSGSTLSLGVAYRNGTALPVVPVIGYHATLKSVYELDILLPGRAYAWRLLSEQRRLGIFGRYETTPYPGPVVSSALEGVLQHRMIRFGISFEERLSSTLSVRTDLASTLVHDRVINLDSSDLDLPTDQSIVLDIALVYRTSSGQK